jgi:hypothetical protein
MSRICVGDYGILCARYIRQLPKELHQPLIHVFIRVVSYGNYDADEHLRRLIEVNIPRGNEKFIKRIERKTMKQLQKYEEENIDAVCEIGILKDLVFCNKMRKENINDQQQEDDYDYNGETKH